VVLCGAAPGLASAAESIILQSTTSTANSGLYDAILPQFTDKTGIQVHVVAVGTGQAIKNAENGDGDVLLVHAKPAEEQFVADGFGVERFDVMYNDFIIVGPKADPAKIAGSKDAAAALRPSPTRARCSRRAATIPARTRRKWRYGSRPASTRASPAGSGIARPAPAWVRP
jgi:ABC-type tungstate transport system permease subunit